MEQNKKIPINFKDSPLGVIPQEWEVKRFKDICKVNQGLQIPIENRLKKYVEGSYKYITIQFLNNGKNAEYILCTNNSVICTPDDVLMTRTGNTGIVISNVDGVFHNNFFKIEFDRAILNKEFLISYLTQPKTKHIILVKAGTSTIPDLNHDDFYSIYMPIPPLAEQERIAEVLGCWDEAIERQGRMVELLTTRKRALMQRLLTPQPHWQKTKLGEICIIKKGKALTANDIISGGYPVIAGGQTSPYNHNCHTDENVITISASGAYAGFVAYHNYKIWASDCSVIIHIENKSDIQYLFHLLTFKQSYIYSLQSGGAQPHIFPKDIAGLKYSTPPIAEQKAIAEKISTADVEIDLARRRLDLLRTQKRAIMQQLLTGKKRLKLQSQ